MAYFDILGFDILGAFTMWGEGHWGGGFILGGGDFKTHSARTVDMLNRQGSPGLTRLEPDIDDIDPDDAFSRVWVAAKDLYLSYCIGEILSLTIYTFYGNLL